MNWFAPKCPLDPDSKQWIESAFEWLIEEFGVEVIRTTAVVLPTDEFFPDTFDGSQDSIRKMVSRVSEYMDVDPTHLTIKFHRNDDADQIHPLAADGETRGHALGSYTLRHGKHTISLDLSQASNPETMVATIAHELGHVILQGENRLDPAYPELEPMTDLVPVVYGLGIFGANSSFVFQQWTNAQFQGWRASGAGYLSEEMFGYSLALFAYLRNESKPAWQTYLNTNVKHYFKSSLKFLAKTNDTSLKKYASNERS
jgi:hypothetical protein